MTLLNLSLSPVSLLQNYHLHNIKWNDNDTESLNKNRKICVEKNNNSSKEPTGDIQGPCMKKSWRRKSRKLVLSSYRTHIYQKFNLCTILLHRGTVICPTPWQLYHGRGASWKVLIFKFIILISNGRIGWWFLVGL